MLREQTDLLVKKCLDRIERDPFWLLRLGTYDLWYNSYYIRNSFNIFVLYHAAMYAFQFVYIIKNRDIITVNLLINYGPTIFGMLYVYMSALFPIFYGAYIKRSIAQIDDEFIPKLDRTCTKPYVVTMRNMFIASITMVLLLAAFYVSASPWSSRSHMAAEFFLSLKICETSHVVYSWAFAALWTSLPWIGYLMAAPHLFYWYLTLHRLVQFAMIRKDLRYLRGGIDDKELNQKEIYGTLCATMDRYIYLKGIIRATTSGTFAFIFVYVIVTTLTGVFVLLFILNIGDVADGATGYFVVSGIAMVVAAHVVVTPHQMILDEIEDMFYINECEWYTWNLDNRKVLLLFMVSTMKPVGIKLAGISFVDRPLLLQVFKLSYTMCTLLFDMKI